MQRQRMRDMFASKQTTGGERGPESGPIKVGALEIYLRLSLSVVPNPPWNLFRDEADTTTGFVFPFFFWVVILPCCGSSRSP